VNKTCKKCGFTAPEEWYWRQVFDVASNIKKYHYDRRYSICPMCLQEERDAKKQKNRWIEKARMAIYSHARKYGIKPVELRNDYGWSIQNVAHKLEFIYRNSCPYCHRLFKDMGHGLRDISLDIINPSLPPYFETNVMAVCQTCNSSKGTRSPTYYGLHLQMAKRRQEFLHSKPKQMTFNL
jgi:5-methylcytosine-specific restriction endonuclease McrA